eukprot:gene24441-29543_t
MGVSSSKYNFRKDKIIENLQVGGLADILGYRNGTEAESLIASHTANNWGFRGKNATKENLVNLCTAAVQGQGKTELCRQLTLCSTIFIDRNIMPGLEEMVPIPISFNQFTSFSKEELKESLEKALIWRILYAFGNEENCYTYQHSLRDLLRDIRYANATASSKSAMKSVGIFLMVDEILKVRDADPTFFKLLLDLLTGLQHRELRESYPTFVLITSLELLPVSEQVVTGSGRKLQPIPMPFLRDLDLESISATLSLQFKKVLCTGRPVAVAAQLDRFKNLDLLIRVAVSISGRHFRSLEEALKALYKRLVSEEQHALARRDSDALLSKASFMPMTSVKSRQFDDIFSKKGGDVDVSIKEIFDSVVNQVEVTSVTREHYQQAMELFLRIINDPAMYVCENELYELEAMKILFVKSRDLDRITFIVPRINLPFLFLYPRADSLSLCEMYDDGDQARGKVSSAYPSYRRLKDPQPILRHTEVLLGNIGAALAQPFSTLARTFEQVMIFAEVLTVAARMLLPSSSSSTRTITMEDLIPGVVFKPWKNETLSVSQFVLQSPIRITGQASSDGAVPLVVPTAVSAVQDAVRRAFDVSSDVVYYAQGKLNMERIEHVSRLFSVRGKQVVSLCSMKLREKTKPSTLARDLHKFVRERVRRADCQIADEAYYAMIYCCTPVASVDVEELPEGTIIVPFESVQRLLYPFGLNKLVVVAEEKCQESKVD